VASSVAWVDAVFWLCCSELIACAKAPPKPPWPDADEVPVRSAAPPRLETGVIAAALPSAPTAPTGKTLT
jgi:hypothetical protein